MVTLVIQLTDEEHEVALEDMRRANREKAGGPAITVIDLVCGVVTSWVNAKRTEQKQTRDRDIQLAFDAADPGTKDVVLRALGMSGTAV